MGTYFKFDPFLKRIGNQMPLVANLLQLMPDKFNTYYEPFVGNGSFLFGLHPNKAVINDSNDELINAYQMVQLHPQELAELLTQYFKHDNASFQKQLRHVDHRNQLKHWTKVKRAARFIFLNLTSATGKWTTNCFGHCNMAYQKDLDRKFKPNPILEDGPYLKDHVIIRTGDFADSIKDVKKGDLVYLNPPYIPVTTSTTISNALWGNFSFKDQQRVAQVAKELVAKEAFVMISNADLPILKRLYPEDLFKINHIQGLPISDEQDQVINSTNEAIITSLNYSASLTD